MESGDGVSNILAELKGITKTFPGVKALQNVDFSLKAGEVHALLGENGAGKSTLVNILSGVFTRDSGQIIINGVEVGNLTPKSAQDMGISIIHQELNLCKHLTVAENIYLAREKTRLGVLDQKGINKMAKSILNSLNLELEPNTLVRDLPVSKQQMVEIAKSLSTDAQIIIMDEPTSALTEKEIEDLFRIMKSLKDAGKGIIYISHRLEELSRIVDRVTILRDGQYITTLDYDKTDLREIIGYMVGRELKEKFPHIDVKRGDKLFEVKDIVSGKAVKSVSFDLYAGEIIGIAGLMGAGRTELVRAIFGADKKISGEISIHNKKIKIRSPRDAIENGLFCVPEDRKKDGLCVKMTVAQNITLPNLDQVSGYGIIKKQLEKDLAERMINSLRIKTPSSDQITKNLSGGNQQKTVVSKWLARNAKIVIFDEPTRGIDVAAKIEIYNLMNELKKQGIGVVFVSSELPEVLGMADRVLVMCDGRLTADLCAANTTQEEILHYATQYGTEEVKHYESVG